MIRPRRVIVNKKEWEWFKEMQDEARTRTVQVSSFILRDPELNEEIELEVKEVLE